VGITRMRACFAGAGFFQTSMKWTAAVPS